MMHDGLRLHSHLSLFGFFFLPDDILDAGVHG
jgi:hypothetical protein